MDLSAENFRGERKSLRLDSLVKSPELQGRADLETVKKMAVEVAEAVKAGADIDPIKIVHIVEAETTIYGKKIEPGYYVADGFRRSAGYEMAGRSMIPAVVRIGTWRDAVDVATSANADQVALPRTPADKRRQVELSFRNHPDRTGRWHADHCKVSNDLAQRVWKDIEKTIPQEVRDKIAKEGRTDKRGRNQPAKKKVAAKKAGAVAADKSADWKGYESAFNFITRFIDHLGELGVKKSDVAKAHKSHKEFGDMLLEWNDELKKSADEAAARAKAAAEKDKAAEAKAKAKDANPLVKEDESGEVKGKGG